MSSATQIVLPMRGPMNNPGYEPMNNPGRAFRPVALVLYAAQMVVERQVSTSARAAQFAMMCCALSLPTAAALIYLIGLAGHPAARFAYPAGKVIQFALPVAWVVFFQRRRIAIRLPTSQGLVAGASLGLAVVAAMFALYYGYLRASPAFASVPAAVAKQMTDFGVSSIGGFLVLAVFISLVHSLAEEYYWRWFVFGQLTESLPLTMAIGLSSIGFMSHHVLLIGKFLSSYGGYTWFFSFCVAAGGALWAWLYHRTRSLYGPWLSHFLVDTGLMWIGWDLWSG